MTVRRRLATPLAAAAFFAKEKPLALPNRVKLRLPGGQRMTRVDVQRLHYARNPGELARYDLRFLLNLKLAHDLTRHFGVSGAVDKLFVELGPGPGMLTRALLTRECRGVLGIEVDTKYNDHLEQIRRETDGKFQWVNANVLEIDEVAVLNAMYPAFVQSLKDDGAGAFDTPRDERRDQQDNMRSARHEAARNCAQAPVAASWADVAPGTEMGSTTQAGGRARLSRHSRLWLADPKVEVVANLPYDHAARVAIRYAVDCSRRENLFALGRIPFHIFFQKAVAERVTAVPGTAAFTALSVITQTYFRTAVRCTFTEKSTFPKPDVYGALLSFEPRSEPLVDVDGGVLFNFLIHFLKASSRRSVTIQILKKIVPLEVADYMLREVHVSGDMSPAYLSVRDIGRLAELWAKYLESSQQFQRKPPASRGTSSDHARRGSTSSSHAYAAQWDDKPFSQSPDAEDFRRAQGMADSPSGLEAMRQCTPDFLDQPIATAEDKQLHAKAGSNLPSM